MDKTASAQEMIEQLSLQAHPEGGWYRQTWAGPDRDGRPEGTCIYFLLAAQETSHWHTVDATEIWLFHAGDPLHLLLSDTDQGPAKCHTLGPHITLGHSPQVVVAKDCWQSARSVPQGRVGWSLVSCVVCPGFVFSGFNLAPVGFTIP